MAPVKFLPKVEIDSNSQFNPNQLTPKGYMKINKAQLFGAMLCLSGHAIGQTVYQDTYDEDGLTTNLGIGGGGVAETFNNASGSFAWNDDDDDDEGLSTGTAGSGAQITTFRTENSFNVSNGFTLEVTFDMESNVDGPGTGVPFPSNHFSFGLVSDAMDGENALFDKNSYVPTTDAIGFSLGTRGVNTDEGVVEWDADGGDMQGLFSYLAPIDFATGSGQTITLEVASDGSFTYTYGTITGSGTTNIDLTQTYFFKARTQGSVGNVIQSVTLSTNSTQFAAPTISTSASVYDLAVPVDFNIVFDPSATTATLSTPTDPSVDLLPLDTDNDGVVVFSEAPPVGISTYEVTASRAGIPAPLSESTEVTVIDPAEEAADNAFSLAIKDDSPLFYYRFEEEAGTTFIRDSSGNAYHTNDFSGNITFGTSPAPGGMQNAADFSPSSGVRYIKVPATSEMSSSFSFVSVLNVSGVVPNTNTRNLLSMTSGTGSGATVFGKHEQFRTFIDGAVDNLTDSEALPSDASCLVHFVFTADEINGGGEVAVYINGELYGSPVTVGAVGANVGNWVIGATQILGDPCWLDWIDETAVFEAALTDVQIEAHATAFFAAADPLLGFNADLTEVGTGDPVTLTWKISDLATAVTINGVAQDISSGGGVYTATFNPTVSTSYEIIVSGPDGPFTKTIDVTVTAPAVAPTITSITTNGVSPDPQVTLEIQGTPNSVFEITYSADLVSGWTYLDTISTDETGYGTKTFPGEGTREFYRVEVP